LPLFVRAAEIFRLFRKKGKNIPSTIDLLIFAIAEEKNCIVFARDRDIETILASGLVEAALWDLEPPPTV